MRDKRFPISVEQTQCFTSGSVSVHQTWPYVTEILIIDPIRDTSRSGTELRRKEVLEIDLSDLRGRAILALVFCLMVAANYLDVPIHEISHGLAAVALGGRFYGLELGPFGGQAYFGGVEGMADKALLAITGILVQYIVGSVCLVLLSRVGERRFVLQSFLLWMAVGNLADPSLSLLTLSRDARRFIYYVVLTTGVVQAFSLMQISALVVCLLAVIVVASRLNSFLLEWFPWIRPGRTRAVSFLICSAFAVALGSFRLLSTWGVQVPYALLFDLLVVSNTTMLVLLLRRSTNPTRYRGFRAWTVIPGVAVFILPHLLLLAPHPLFAPVPIG